MAISSRFVSFNCFFLRRYICAIFKSIRTIINIPKQIKQVVIIAITVPFLVSAREKNDGVKEKLERKVLRLV